MLSACWMRISSYGTDVMMSNPKRTLLAGLLLGALVIGASVMRSGEDKLPGAQSGSERDGASISGELDNGSVQTQRSNPASASGHSDDISHILQAIRESLKRNDLASAKVLLGAVQTLHKDDSRALTLQKELQAREEKADPVPPVAPPDNPRNTAKSTRSVKRLPARAERSHERASQVREHTISTSRRSRIMDAPQIKAPSNSSVNAEAASPFLGGGRTDSSSRAVAPPVAPTAAPTVSSAPPRPALVRAMPPIEEVLQPVQPVALKPLPMRSDQAPKTRAQVRAELDRARTDGSLPRFGNPDPAGPGGVPSSTKTESDSE
jgi:hypothetical protein